MIPPIADRFIAGEDVSSALEHVDEINEHQVGGILNLLGEHYHSPEPAKADAEAYLELIDQLSNTSQKACISIKPSQIGQAVDVELFNDQLDFILERAAEKGCFVWLDMEDSSTTDDTVDAYERAGRQYPDSLGVCLQANLKRTAADIKRLGDVPGKIRLVKGAYDEPGEIAYRERSAVNTSYKECLELLFDLYDDGIAIGSHDPVMIEHARQLHDTHGSDYEVQMLMGVRTQAQYELASEGVEVWQYVPYGSKWVPYFYRRVMERRENLTFALRALIGR